LPCPWIMTASGRAVVIIPRPTRATAIGLITGSAILSADLGSLPLGTIDSGSTAATDSTIGLDSTVRRSSAHPEQGPDIRADLAAGRGYLAVPNHTVARATGTA